MHSTQANSVAAAVQEHQHQHQHQLPVATPGRAPLRADHSLLLLPSRCLPAAPPLRPCPVATVAPLKRRLATGDAAVEHCGSVLLPPAAKLARRHEAGGIATNPRYRRRSRQQQQQEEEEEVAAEKAAEKEQENRLPRTPIAVAKVTKDAQTSPLSNSVAESPSLRQSRRSPLLLASAGGWARKRLANIRRSLSSSRVDADVAVAASSSSSSYSSPSSFGTPNRRRHDRRRQSSLQRLVQRLAPSPKSLKLSKLDGQPSGCVLQVHRDGSRTVRLRREREAKFGFFVQMQSDGVFLSRFNDTATQLRYKNLVSIGDKILEIEGHSTESMQQADIFRVIADRRQLLLRVQQPDCVPAIRLR